MAGFARSRAEAQKIGSQIRSSRIATKIVKQTVGRGAIMPVGKTAEVCSNRQLKTRRKLGIAPLNLVIEQDGIYAVACDGPAPLFMRVEGPNEVRALFNALTRCAKVKGTGAKAQDACARDLAASRGATTKADRREQGLRGYKTRRR